MVIVSDLRGPRDWVGGLREIGVKHDVVVSRSATPPRRPSPTSARSSSSIRRPGRHVRVDTSRKRMRERLRRRRRGGARAGRPRHPRGRRPPSHPLDRRRLAAAARHGPRQQAGAAMTFEWPLALLALAVIPLALLVLFLARRRRASRYAVRFSNVDVLAGVVRARPARRGASCRRRCCSPRSRRSRSGIARPSISVSAERKQGTVVLALDRSGSMLAQDVAPDRITASQRGCAALRQGTPGRLPRRRRHVLRHRRRRRGAELRPRCRREGDRRHPGRRRNGHRRRDQQLARPARRQPARPEAKKAKGRAILLLSDGSNTQGVDPSRGRRCGQARRRARLHDRARHARRRARPAGARRRARHDSRPARSGRAARRSRARPAASRSPRSTSRR